MSPLPSRQGELLVVPAGARLPKVCLKCGGKHDVSRRALQLAVGKAGQATAGVGGIVGVVFAQTMRDVERTVAVAAFAVLIATASVVAWLMQRGTPKVAVPIPLCKTCDAAWTEGETLRWRIVAALGGAFALLAAGYAAYSTPLLVAGGVGFGLAIVAAVAAGLPKRFVPALAVSAESVSLKVDPAIADDVVERARRRAERRAAKPGDGDEET